MAFQELGQRAFVAYELEAFAFIAQAQIQPARAARLLGAAEALRERVGVPVLEVERLEIDRAVAWLHTQLSETDYTAHWSEGCAMTVR